MKKIFSAITTFYTVNTPTISLERAVITESVDSAAALIAKWNREGNRGGYSYLINRQEETPKEELPILGTHVGEGQFKYWRKEYSELLVA